MSEHTTDWWMAKPWRQIQMNLRQIDMADIRAKQLVEDLQAFQANVFMINTAGIIASYPTDLPFHFQSDYLQGDSLAEIIDACHAAEIRVVARTDFSKVRRPIYEQHPDWAYVSAKGNIIDYNGDIAVCLNGDYQQHYMFQIVAELFTKLPFDGIFFNMSGYQTRDYSGNYYGPCHCANCQARFQAMAGLELPVNEDWEDPRYRQYNQFKVKTLAEHRAKLYHFINERWPHVAIASLREFGRGFIRQESNTAIDRPLPHWQYSGSDNAKWASSSYPTMLSSNTTVDFIDFPYRHVTVSPHQQQLRLVQGLANGNALDWYLIGRIDNHEDRSGFAPIKAIFHYHAAHEESYAHLTSKANIALLNGAQANQSEFRGWFRFLVEHHFLFDTLMEEVALELPWDKYEAIILPDYQPISDALADRLDRFVANGGTLIASGRSGFRDETYTPRAQPVLVSLGIERFGTMRNDMRSAYFKLDDKRSFPRLDEVDLLYSGDLYLYPDYAATAQPHLRLVAPHAFGPPERCYYTQVTNHPGYVVNRYGQGQTIYLPWLPGALFHRQGYPNTTDFIGDLLEQVAGLTAVAGDLSPMVEVTHFTRTDGAHDLVHLVNGSGHFGNSFFAPVPMTELNITVRCARRPQVVKSLVNDTLYNYNWHDEGLITIDIPRLGLFDAIQIS
ncbi:MAG: beta-galactosidase trimerization domain-containing protein [Caldilineaceae bacterium]|nr:beta-galactosidase trimerization domain-containing protein [Caldilineaceae bacterium]